MSAPERFQWCCSQGCGACAVKRVEFPLLIEQTLEGVETRRETEPHLVSACCAAPLMMWDNEKDEEIYVP